MWCIADNILDLGMPSHPLTLLLCSRSGIYPRKIRLFGNYHRRRTLFLVTRFDFQYKTEYKLKRWQKGELENPKSDPIASRSNLHSNESFALSPVLQTSDFR